MGRTKRGLVQLSLIIVCSVGGYSASAQQPSEAWPVSVGYYGHYLIQPGLKVSAHLEVDRWNRGRQTAGSRRWVVSPQVGVYTRPGNEASLMVNAEVGYRRFKTEKRFYRGASLGLGYLAQAEVLGTRVRLSDGATRSAERDLRHFVVPSLSYEWGRRTRATRGWYVKYAIGHTLSPVREGQMVMFVELGLTFWRVR